MQASDRVSDGPADLRSVLKAAHEHFAYTDRTTASPIEIDLGMGNGREDQMQASKREKGVSWYLEHVGLCL